MSALRPRWLRAPPHAFALSCRSADQSPSQSSLIPRSIIDADHTTPCRCNCKVNSVRASRSSALRNMRPAFAGAPALHLLPRPGKGEGKIEDEDEGRRTRTIVAAALILLLIPHKAPDTWQGWSCNTRRRLR